MKNFRIPFFVPWIFPRRIWKLKSKNTVYLTFDDGPQVGLTDWILDFLNERKIRATFFCVGENVKNYPELFAKIQNLLDEDNGLWIKDDNIYPVNFERTYYAGMKVKF